MTHGLGRVDGATWELVVVLSLGGSNGISFNENSINPRTAQSYVIVRKGKERKSIYIAPFCTKVHSKHSGREPNFAALNRGRHLRLSGRPSRWPLAQNSSSFFLSFFLA